MTYEGVTFIAENCLKMSRSEFIAAHIEAFWADRDKQTRKKMLGKAYDLMAAKEEED